MGDNNFDFFVGSSTTRKDCYWKIKLLSRSIKSKKSNNKQDYQDNKKKYQDQIDKYNVFIENQKEVLKKLDLDAPHPYIKNLPKHSFFLQFEFKLRKPFYSHDDEDFYIIDNPLTKEHIFKIPMIRPSGWKGYLKKTMININGLSTENCNDISVNNLFGYSDKDGKNQKKGRLIFYPTYFDKIGIEVINPHDRKTKSGTNPIPYEVVPTRSTGLFSLLYVPFDLIGKDEKIKTDLKSDYQKIIPAVKSMMIDYGFGAKTSSGFGVIESKIKNVILGINSIELQKSDITEFDELIKIVGDLQ